MGSWKKEDDVDMLKNNLLVFQQIINLMHAPKTFEGHHTLRAQIVDLLKGLMSMLKRDAPVGPANPNKVSHCSSIRTE